MSDYSFEERAHDELAGYRREEVRQAALGEPSRRRKAEAIAEDVDRGLTSILTRSDPEWEVPFELLIDGFLVGAGLVERE